MLGAVDRVCNKFCKDCVAAVSPSPESGISTNQLPLKSRLFPQQLDRHEYGFTVIVQCLHVLTTKDHAAYGGMKRSTVEDTISVMRGWRG